MSDTIEKIYCNEASNDNALAAAIMAGCNKGSGDNAALLAALNNNNWGNNPFIYLVWMMFAQRMWGNDGNGNNAGQIASLQGQVQDNQNTDLLMDAIKGNAAAIGQLAGNLNCDFNAVQGAINGVVGQISNLSNSLQLQLCQQTNTLTNAINAVAAGNNANTQRILDTLNNHWASNQALEIQDLKFQNSQLKQNQYLAGLITGGNGIAGFNGLNPNV